MDSKRHLLFLLITISAWVFFYILGIPSDYFLQWSFQEKVLLSLVTFFGAVPLIGFIVMALSGGNYIETGLWLAFYASVPLFILDFMVVGLIQGDGLKFLVSHWYISIAYLYVWAEVPLLGLAMSRFKGS